MPGPYGRRGGWHGRFRGKGFRMTIPRQVILETLNTSENYLTADELYMIVHREYPGIGIATIYRTLNLLEQMNIVNKIDIGDGKARYEIAKQDVDVPHYHQMICTNCSRIIKYERFSDEELELMKKVQKQLEESYDFTIQRHVVQYYGICGDCRRVVSQDADR